MRAPRRGEGASSPRAQSEERAGEDDDPCPEVEDAVSECVVLEPGQSVRRTAAFTGEDVMPLQDLVKDDAVDETAEPDAEQQCRQQRPVLRWVRFRADVPRSEHTAKLPDLAGLKRNSALLIER